MRISKLQRWRKFVNLKQTDAADLLGISPFRYKNLETARIKTKEKVPDAIWLACAAIALGLKPISVSLKDWRELNGMSVEDAASFLGQSMATYIKYEASDGGPKKGSDAQRWMLLACAARSRGITYYRGPESIPGI